MVVISLGGYSCKNCRACRITVSVLFSTPISSTNKKKEEGRQTPFKKGILFSMWSLDCLQTFNTEERKGGGEKKPL